MQFFYVVFGSCYLQEEKLQIMKIFTTCDKKFENFQSVPIWEKCPYRKFEGWKRKQYFLSTSTSCQKADL